MARAASDSFAGAELNPPASKVLNAGRLRQAVRIIARLLRVLECAEGGLTLPQYRILAVLAEGGEKSARLAEKLAIRKPTLTVAADGLVSGGYAVRESDPCDRRVVRLVITDVGRRALHHAESAFSAQLGSLLAKTSDPSRLLALMVELESALDHHPCRVADRSRTAQA